MNAYEEKRMARAARLRERAAKLQQVANTNSIDKLCGENNTGIPMGQPILVGHHSERRHRKALERIDNKLRKGFEAGEEAARLREAAVAAENNNTISADDPEAIQKLKEKLAGMEKHQAAMVAANKIYRSGPQTEESIAAIMAASGLTRENAIKGYTPYLGDLGFPGFTLRNNSANMRRVKLRIAQLEKTQAKPSISGERKGFQVEDDTEANRTRVLFPGKPAQPVIQWLKSHGFRWSPTNKAWQRSRSNGTDHLINELEKYLSVSLDTNT